MKTRLLFIVPLPPPVHGSTVMCNYIKDSGLINGEFDCKYVNLSASRNMEEVHRFMWVKIWRFFYAYFNVFFKLLSHRYDLCYIAIAFHKGLLKDVPFVFLCKLFRRKVVIHLHGKGASEDAQNGFYRWLLRNTFKNTKVIMLSWLLYPDVEQFVKREDVSICPNGIPVANLEYKERHNPIPRLLFLSNLIVSKGVIVLLDALKILKDKGYSFVCDFVGCETKEIDGNRFAEEVNKRGLNQLVIYHGKKYGHEKEQMFNQADVFVFPTNEDCFPLVLLEAMSYHLPIITTNEGAIPDEVIDGETGYIVNKKNSDCLATKIQELADNKERRLHMGLNGYRKFKEQYTLQVFENRLCNVLEQLV